MAWGMFAALSLVGHWARPGFEANIWWIDAYGFPGWLREGLLGLTAAVLMAWGIRPVVKGVGRWVSLGCLGVVIVIAVANATVFYRLLGRGDIRSAVPIPVSLIVAAGMGLIAWQVLSDEPKKTQAKWKSGLAMGAGMMGFVVLFPLLQIVLYGQTDYRRKADAIVVFGAKVYADGTPSSALADRVRMGCELYRQGYAPALILSGGPGAGQTHETVAMQKLAVELGVPEEVIVRDEEGVNTRATVRNLDAIAREAGIRRVLAVSHSWHLPRIKLAAEKGRVRVYTVPCREERPLRATPFYMAREVAAFWKYYVGELVDGGLAKDES